jgi:hypothetical protein
MTTLPKRGLIFGVYRVWAPRLRRSWIIGIGNPALPGVCESRIVRRQRIAGAKARIFFSPVTARLKPCPDTKPQSGDARKARVFPRISPQTEKLRLSALG